MKNLVRPTAIVLSVACLLSGAHCALADKEQPVAKAQAIMAFLTPDGAVLAAAGKENTRLIKLAEKKAVSLAKEYQPIVLAPDGKTLAAMRSASADAWEVNLYDVPSGASKGAPFTVPSEGVLADALTPDGKTFVRGLLKDLLLVDTATGKVTHTFKDLGGQPFSVAVSADGKYLACGTDSAGKKVYVWDLATLKPVQVFTGLPGYVQAVAFSPDGKQLAACSDELVRVWDLGNGQVVKSLKGTKDKIVRSVAFGNEGKTLVWGRSDGLVMLWDLPADKALDRMKMPKDVFGVSMSKDGKTLAVTMDEDGAVVFDLSALYGK